MQLELATVISCESTGCRVLPVSGGVTFDAHYSTLVLNRVKIQPGQLVAVDMDALVPEVAWRWYRVQVVDAGENSVTVQERERQLSAVRVPGLDLGAKVGDELWLSGMQGVWELHDRVANGKPANPSRLWEKVIPRITGLLASSEQK